MMPGDTVTVRWAGTTIRATVVSVFKNGRVRVEHYPYGTGWQGGRYGTPVKPERMTVEDWQVVPD